MQFFVRDGSPDGCIQSDPKPPVSCLSDPENLLPDF